MEITQNRKYGIIHVTVEGRSETELSSDFENAIRDIVENDNRQLLLDLSALPYLKSSALRVILNTAKVINRRKGRIVLCSLNGYVKEIFEGNCLKDTLEIADSVESGLSALIMTDKAA